MRKVRLVFFSVLGTVIALVLLGLIVVFTGVYNVAATAPHAGVTRWALNTLQQNSVGARAEEVEGTLPTDSAALYHGFEHFHAMCVTCHGAPGIDRGELGQGMNPEPPELSDKADEWSDRELFWVTKHGIRLAGMPAFGRTHSEEEIWAITAFVRGLPGMSPEEYDRLVQSLERPESQPEAGHTHPEGTPEHEHFQ